MANKEHLEILLRGLTEWNAWREDNPEIKADLSRADLRSADLSFAELNEAKLSKANLNQANLFGANLSGADLSEAKLFKADLSETDLSEANLSEAILLDADLSEAKLFAANLIEADLSGANLRRATLSEAKLRGADLFAANLIEADLSGADLRRADLSRADLSFAELNEAKLNKAKLNEANLTQAKLNKANLREARLRGADLSGAKLIQANLNKANLRAGNLTSATLTFTSLSDIDLSQCKGLEGVIHIGPSDIATSTLERTAKGLEKDPSQRGAVEWFLRGAGVPESLITEWFAHQIAKPIEFYSCFISYSHEDKSFARRVYESLQARGIRCWLDEHQLLPGDDIYDAVDLGIRLWDKVLLCCSEASLTSWWVEDEIDKALEKEQQLRKQRGEKLLAVIPLDLDRYLFNSWQDGRAAAIRKRMAADFTGWATDNAKFEAAFEKVVKALQTEGAREAPPTPKL